MPLETPTPFTPEMLAERWQCTPRHIHRLCNSGKLKSFRVGRLLRISAADVEAYESGGKPAAMTAARTITEGKEPAPPHDAVRRAMERRA